VTIHAKEKGWVYFAAVRLRYSHQRAIKIGWSTNVPQRIDTLRSEYASLVFIGAKKAPFAEEKKTHKKFADFLLKGREIFLDVPVIRKYAFSICDKKLKSFPRKPPSLNEEAIYFRIPMNIVKRLDREIERLEAETPGIRSSRAQLTRMIVFKYVKDLDKRDALEVGT